MKKIFLFLFHHWSWILIVIVLLLAIWGIRSCVKVLNNEESFSLTIMNDDHIDLTPAQVRSIRKIGKWEFLSVQMEELVDTTRSRWFVSDDELVRIYRGTIRLGVDMEQLSENWFQQKGDTAVLLIPPIQPLNEQFIDEAQTTTFSESGSWNHEALEGLYAKAERQMKRRLTESNAYEQAEENGRLQIAAFMQSLGIQHTKIFFER